MFNAVRNCQREQRRHTFFTFKNIKQNQIRRDEQAAIIYL